MSGQRNRTRDKSPKSNNNNELPATKQTTTDAHNIQQEQPKNQPYTVKIFIHRDSEVPEEINSSHRLCTTDRGNRSLYTLEEGEKMHVTCGETFTIECMSYLTDHTNPINCTAEHMAHHTDPASPKTIVIKYQELDQYPFNAVCIRPDANKNDADVFYVGVLLKSYDDAAFQNKLYLDYIENVHVAEDITRNGGLFTTLTNVVIRKVDSNGDGYNETSLPEVLFVRKYYRREDRAEFYEFYAYVSEDNGISVEFKNKGYIIVEHWTRPDNSFAYDSMDLTNTNLFMTETDENRVLIDKLFPKKNTCLEINVYSKTVKIVENIVVRVLKVSGKFLEAVKNRKNPVKQDHGHEIDVDNCTFSELTNIFREIKAKQSNELNHCLSEFEEDKIAFLTMS